MIEPSITWNQQQEDNCSSLTDTKCDKLNVNTVEFSPSIASESTSASTISTSVITKNTIEDEKKQIEGQIKLTELNDQQEIIQRNTITDIVSDDLTTNKARAVNEFTTQKEAINIVVERDIIRQRETLDVLFCGHIDVGISTIYAQLMFSMGHVDQQTLEKYRNEARELLYSSWESGQYEERKGQAAEGHRHWFETMRKRCNVLGQINYRFWSRNRIATIGNVDIAILVISARKGEFETGFERGGQTREHAMLVKTAGVRYLVVLINKMDDPTVNWDQTRYEEIRDKLTPYLKKCGFKPGEDTYFMPCSGMSGVLLKEHPGEQFLPWYKGPTFIEYLDSLPSFNRNIDGPLRMPIIERYKEMGVIIMGKIESGCCRIGDRCLVMPNRTRVEVTNIYYEDIETDSCVCGENVRLKLKNIEEEEISPGFILCDVEQEPCGVGRIFDAQIAIIEYKSIICPGYSAVLHIHAAAVEVQLIKLIVLIDRKTGERTLKYPRFIKQDQVAIARFELSQSGQAICMEPFKRFPQLGRFTLRDEGRTVAVGKVLKIIE
ncbi:unnamed protein product [Rotaria sp. Silwood2]|nr:unnamed protein product [Rotaria sp. Silwood2]